MNRRSFVATGCGAVVASVSGCLGAAEFGDDSAPSPDGTPLYPDERDVPPEAGTHDLFVENFDDVVYDVTLTVVRPSDDALVWRAAYEAPDRRGFSIPDLLVEGRTYEITLDVADGPEASDTRTIEACRNPQGGSRNVGVWIEDGSVTFEQDICDELRVGAELNYGDHESFIVEDSA